MTEISTNEVNPVESMTDDHNGSSEDLEPHEKHFFRSLSLRLNQLQLNPKQETVLKIINYSKSKR